MKPLKVHGHFQKKPGVNRYSGKCNLFSNIIVIRSYRLVIRSLKLDNQFSQIAIRSLGLDNPFSHIAILPLNLTIFSLGLQSVPLI